MMKLLKNTCISYLCERRRGNCPLGPACSPSGRCLGRTSAKGSWGAAFLTGIPSCPRYPGTSSLAPHCHGRMNGTALALLESLLCARHQAELLPHVVSLKLTASCSVGVTITVYRWGSLGEVACLVPQDTVGPGFHSVCLTRSLCSLLSLWTASRALKLPR